MILALVPALSFAIFVWYVYHAYTRGTVSLYKRGNGKWSSQSVYKITVCGVTCSGKSTLTKTLSKELNLYLIELDEFHHLPGWKTRPVQEFRELVRLEIKKADDSIAKGVHNGWIVDGNYRKIRHITWNQSTLCIWLNYAKVVNWFRLTYRILYRWWYQIACCNGNYESMWGHLKVWHPDSLYYWLLFGPHSVELAREFGRNTHILEEDPIDISKAHVFRMESPLATEKWIEEIRQNTLGKFIASLTN